VGLLWDGDEIVFVYSQSRARVRAIGRDPKVTLNFGGLEAAATALRQ
jgi:hypothetical protein